MLTNPHCTIVLSSVDNKHVSIAHFTIFSSYQARCRIHTLLSSVDSKHVAECMLYAVDSKHVIEYSLIAANMLPNEYYAIFMSTNMLSSPDSKNNYVHI